MWIETTARIENDEITIDLTGSNPEVSTGYNVPFGGSLLVAAYFVIRTLLLDEATHPEHVPQNDGVFRSVQVEAPRSTIYNPTFARACFSCFCQIQRVIDNTILALSEVLPTKATAGDSAGVHFCSYSGFDEASGQYWIYLEVNEGSYGGRCGKDAMDSVDNLMINTRNNSIEELDMRFPVRCELRDTPAAPGRWRGGIGIVRENRFLVNGTYSSEGDHAPAAPRPSPDAWRARAPARLSGAGENVDGVADAHVACLDRCPVDAAEVLGAQGLTGDKSQRVLAEPPLELRAAVVRHRRDLDERFANAQARANREVL